MFILFVIKLFCLKGPGEIRALNNAGANLAAIWDYLEGILGLPPNYDEQLNIWKHSKVAQNAAGQ